MVITRSITALTAPKKKETSSKQTSEIGSSPKSLSPAKASHLIENKKDLPAGPTVPTTTASHAEKPTAAPPAPPATPPTPQRPSAPTKSLPSSGNGSIKLKLKAPVKKTAVIGSRISRSFPSKVGKQKVRGLGNPHNWCYRRSLLQALISVPHFFNLLDNSHQGCNKTASQCVSCQLRALVQCYQGDGQQLGQTLRNLDATIRATGKNSDPKWIGTGSSQEDSHEFLQYLMGTIEKTQAKGAEKKQFQDLFQVGHETSWKCDNCNKIHKNADPASYSLQLPISAANGKPVTMASCLDAYHLERGLTIRCDGCKTNISRTRQHRIQTPPEVLVVQFKRFSWGIRGPSKNSKRVPFNETLDVSRWTTDPSKPAKYNLQAVVAHSGSLKIGHYIAYIRGPDGVRRISDDAVTKPTDDKAWLNPKGFDPYILFYIKQ